jgi:catechol 2,3-dioxygenase-like lactoylglutathione lyase family enzyme
MFIRIDHVEVIPSDFDRSLGFYQDIVGFHLVQRLVLPEGPLREIAYLKLGDGVIELMRFDEPVEGPKVPSVGCRAIALEVQSMEASTEYLRGKGVAVTWGPMDLGGSIRAEIVDPDGTPIELREWREKPW